MTGRTCSDKLSSEEHDRISNTSEVKLSFKIECPRKQTEQSITMTSPAFQPHQAIGILPGDTSKLTVLLSRRIPEAVTRGEYPVQAGFDETTG